MFYQPFVENIVPCPKVTSNCKTVGDEEAQNNCLKCCTADIGKHLCHHLIMYPITPHIIAYTNKPG